MRNAGVPRRTRLLLAAGFAVRILLGAAVGYLALQEAPQLLTRTVLAMTGGALAAVVVEEMVSEAHEGETFQPGPLFLTAGFATFAAISIYLGQKCDLTRRSATWRARW